MKDLGVWTGEDASFEDHIEYLVQSSKVRTGMLLRHFKTREPEPMTTMFNSYVRSRLEYCSLVWNPWKKEDIDKLERVQKNFTSKIVGLEKLNYHQRLKKLRMYSIKFIYVFRKGMFCCHILITKTKMHLISLNFNQVHFRFFPQGWSITHSSV